MAAPASAVCPGSGQQFARLAGYRSLVCAQCFHSVPLTGDGTVLRHDTDGMQLTRGGYVPRPRIVREDAQPKPVVHVVTPVVGASLEDARRVSVELFARSLRQGGCAEALATALQAEYRLAGWLR